MERVTGQESTETIDESVDVDESALDSHEPGQAVVGPEPGPAHLFRYSRRRQDTESREPKTTWVWDRSRQTWSEIIEKPATDDLPGGNSASVAPDQIEAAATITVPVPDDALRPASPVRLRAIRSTLGRMLDVLTLRVRFSHPGFSRSSTTELMKRGEPGRLTRERWDAEELAAIIVDRAAKEARKTLVEAEARAESIIARAEERTKAQADIIITKAVDAAQTAAMTVISDAGEKTKARTEIIVSQAIERAEAESRAIMARAQERAQAQADRLVAATEEACRQRLAEIEAQTGSLIQAPDKPAREDPVTRNDQAPLQQAINRTRARAPQAASIQPAQVAQKTRNVPDEGRAELVIKHPVNIGRMQRMLNRLGKYPEIKIVDLAGSPGKGVAVELYSYRLGRLASLLEALPEVDEVAQLSAKASKICPGQRICPGLGSGSPVVRLLVKLARHDEILDV